MKKLVAVYERKSTLFVTADHRTKAGFWIGDEQVISLNGPTAEELGQAIEEALARSKDGVPTPPPTARFDRPLLKAAGVGSWSTFMKLSRHVSVSSSDGILKITPYRNLGGKGGFEPGPESVSLELALPPAIGQLVLDLLARPI
jgi:hypothetical protein